MPVAYRVRQFCHALLAKVAAPDESIVQRYLSPAQLELFRKMPPDDRRHCVAVLRGLLEAGHDSPDLLCAALLHDVGKSSCNVSLGVRVAVVLLARLDRRVADLFASPLAEAGWRHQLYVHRHHAEIGAKMAALAGCRDSVVRLIRGHGEVAADPLAKALHDADGQS